MRHLIFKSIGNINKPLLLTIKLTALLSSNAFAGQWSTENNLSGMDSVHIYVPTTAPQINNKRALMINLHGCQMSNTDMRNYADWSPTADQFGMVVALPDVPGNGPSNYSCWDYYGSNHSRNNKYNNDIIALTNELIGRSELNIDPKQVYITGFSSGGGQANVIACLAPDIFAGVGSSAGPGLGTTAYQYSSVPWNYSVSGQATFCQNLAGEHAASFDTQLYSTIHGSADTVVAPGFNTSGADIMANVYGASVESAASTISTGGTKVIFSDDNGPRVSRISVSGMGHDWSTGNGGSTGYFVNNKVDYPNYVTQWFFDNNLRLETSNVDFDKDGFSEVSDCDDFDATIFPGATEMCDDGIDQSCSGSDLACTPDWECKEYTSYNTTHYNASPQRATYWFFNFQYYYYAKGSSEQLSLTNPYSITTVSETSEGYFEAGSCS